MATDVRIGRIDADTLPDFRRVFAQTFGHSMSEERLGQLRPWHERDRMVAAFAGDQVVGTSGAYTFELSLPGAEPVGCAGVTVVSVRADHRRRGVLTRMMRQLFEDADERGEPFAALWASEAPIYGRYGFGPAAPTITLEVPRAARLRTPVDVSEVELVDAATATDLLPTVYDAVRRHRPGMLGLGEGWWERLVDDDPGDRHGAGEKRFARLGDRAVAVYRLKGDWADGLPTGTVQLHDLYARDPQAAATMWQFVLDTDLATTISAHRWAVDEPLPLLLANEGLAKRQLEWPLMVALVDLPTALGARSYAVDDTLTLRVHDPFQARNDGTWRLAVTDGRATCESTDAHADLELSADVLAALSLGGQRATAYAAAGRLEVLTPGAAARLDRLVATDVAPWHHVMF
ncbi:GNAT family N-acetyltransferase [Egicoccus halophilus]|uniref:UPF0256 protein n=1 Tax=Egicoccus halophilus TaxID=1670830 RepID=A0A8J3ETV1_9ACTN|nr:GNAT family N-acetyltransferase [Egicoccus halophilus]GGI06346.1 UPF0256 protein [Egicoccus halophilus]